MATNAGLVPGRNLNFRPEDNEPSVEVMILNEQRQDALELLNNANFSWAHARICFVAGIGFFTEAYDIFAISIMVPMLGYVWGNENGDLRPWEFTALQVAAPIGNLVGQVLFGLLADALGRRRMYGAELIIMTTATFGQALSGSAIAVNVIYVLILWRFIMGVGCGGDYPASAVIVSEFAPIRTRGRLMTAVLASQGWGRLAAGLVAMFIIVAYRDAIRNADYPCAHPVDYAWRLLVGLGCVPGLVAYCCRLTIPETPRFTMDVERSLARASSNISNIPLGERDIIPKFNRDLEQVVAAPRASFTDFIRYFSKRDNLKVLIGIAYSWFALGVPFYSLTLNSAAILTYSNFGKVYGNSSNDVYQSLFRICSGNLVLTVAGTIPGFWASFYFIDSWGRKPIQLMGFATLTTLFLVMSFAYIPLNSTVAGKHAFVVLYCLAHFFQNFGAHTTTYVIPGEVFPTRYRATAYGISAACGTVGAVIAPLAIGQELLGDLRQMQLALQALSFLMFTGVLSTLLIPETKQRTLEDLSGERQETYIIGVLKRGVPPFPI